MGGMTIGGLTLGVAKAEVTTIQVTSTGSNQRQNCYFSNYGVLINLV